MGSPVVLLCRICGSTTDGDTFVDIFSAEGEKNHLEQKLNFCFTKEVLNILKEDVLSTKLCTICCSALDNTYLNAKRMQQFQMALFQKFMISTVGKEESIKPSFQTVPNNSTEKKTARPNQLSLHDIFSHTDDTSQLKNEPKRPKIETKAELLSTPEGPEANGHEDLKLQEFVIYSSEASSTSQPQSLIPQTLLINQKNVELLNPSQLPKIPVSSTSNGDNTDVTTIPTIHWAENELYPTASLPKGYTSKTVTSTLKDYRPPPKANGLSIYQNGSLEKNPRLASTIYKCQTCTKGFVSQEILENHMKIHAETTSVTQSVSGMMTEPKIMSEKLDCSICGKVFSSKATLKRHQSSHNTTTQTLKIICPICQASFEQKSALATHIAIQHSKKS